MFFTPHPYTFAPNLKVAQLNFKLRQLIDSCCSPCPAGVSDVAKLHFARTIFAATFAHHLKDKLLKTLTKAFATIMLAAVSLAFVSCSTNRNAVYFNTLSDTSFSASGLENQPLIQKNDLISIYVSSLNPEATTVFNTPNIPTLNASTSMGTQTQISGYLVNPDGTIQFPVLGSITAAGLTKKQLSDTIARKLVTKKLLVDPIVNIRFLNFKVTVMGEVARPTVISVANEKISILEAIGLAGDLTIYARRDNVLLIREEGGKKIIRRLNLNSSDIFTSPYYYLKTNDVIYAEPNNAKMTAASNARMVWPIVLSGLSFIAIILTRVF